MQGDLRKLTEASYWAIDIEGDGHPVATPVEVALVHFYRGAAVETKHWMINPRRSIDHYVSKHIHGITNEMVRNKPTFDEVVDEIRDTLRDQVVIGHAIGQDFKMLRPVMTDIDEVVLQAVDTMKLLKLIIPGKKKTNLMSACEELQIEHGGPDCFKRGGFHDAVSDAHACGELLLNLVNKIPDDYKAAKHIAHCVTFKATPQQLDKYRRINEEASLEEASGPKP